MVNYQDIRNSLKTGDVVLYSGRSLFSMAIRLSTKSNWSHCGMVIRLEEYDFVAVWESTLLTGIKDLETNTHKRGVQLMPLSDRVNKYRGDIAIRSLEDVTLNKEDIIKLMQLRKELARRDYESNAFEMLKAAYDGDLGANTEDLSAIFCSELLAEAYQSIGLLDEKTPSNEYTPADFSDDNTLPLLRGKLGPEVIIKDIY